MSYDSKKNLLSVAAGVILMAAYTLFALGGNAPAPEDLQAWARAMLVFIGIGAAAVIVIQILFHAALAIGIAVREREQGGEAVERIISSTMAEDERDKLVNLKSSLIGYIIAGGGLFSALAALAAGAAAVAALHISFGALGAASIAEGIARIVCYEKGVKP